MIEIPSLLIFAIMWQESGVTSLDPYHCGDPYILGDKGYAYGLMQIHQCVIDDVNRVYKTSYAHTDAFDRELAIEIFKLYITIYATEQRLGHEATPQDMARIWNGGPDGWQKDSTLEYWNGKYIENIYYPGVKKKYESLVRQNAKIDL